MPVLLFALAEGPESSAISHLQDGRGLNWIIYYACYGIFYDKNNLGYHF